MALIAAHLNAGNISNMAIIAAHLNAGNISNMALIAAHLNVRNHSDDDSVALGHRQYLFGDNSALNRLNQPTLDNTQNDPRVRSQHSWYLF